MEKIAPRIKDRGKALTTLLVLKGAFGLVMIFVAMAALARMTPAVLDRLPKDVVAQVLALRAKLLVVMLTTAVDLVAVTGTWMFKRWGVVVLAASSGALFVLRVVSGETLVAVAGIVVAGSVVAAIVPRWHDYD